MCRSFLGFSEPLVFKMKASPCLVLIVLSRISTPVLGLSCPNGRPLHTLCLPQVGPRCPRNSKVGLDLGADQQDTVLKFHNHIRKKIALGQVSGFPSAAQMNRLEWDQDLAQVAQYWANQCTDNHDQDRSTPRFHQVGQNIFSVWKWPSDASVDVPIREAVQAWLDEFKLFRSYGYDVERVPHFGTIGHFTQMIWAETTHVGCGFSGLPDDGGWTRIIVCNYGPGGNVLDGGSGVIYPRGSPCSKCSAGSRCSDGLCQSK